MRLAMSLMAGALAVLGLAGCGDDAEERVTEEAIEASVKSQGGEVDVDVSEGGERVRMSGSMEDGEVEVEAEDNQMTMRGQTEEGEYSLSMGEDTTLPPSWPEDVPIYDGVQINMAMEMPQQDGFTLQATAPASVEQIANWYQEAVKKNDWEEQQNVSQGEMRSMTYQKDGRMLNVVIMDEGDQTTLMVSTSKQ